MGTNLRKFQIQVPEGNSLMGTLWKSIKLTVNLFTCTGNLLNVNLCATSFFQSYTSLKDALRVCAAFRGCYLDKKDRADETNQQRLSEQSGTKWVTTELTPLTLKRTLNVCVSPGFYVAFLPCQIQFNVTEIQCWLSHFWLVLSHYLTEIGHWIKG